ncbi:MAG: FliH/SctL family protein [Solirubrobacteraceae bacterium]|jgi:flagellar assembly protein FliH
MSSEQPSAYAFEQLEASALVRSSLGEVQLAAAVADGSERQLQEELRTAREQGRAAGLADAREEIEFALATLAEARRGLDGLRDEVIQRTERAAVELAIALAEQIVAGALEAQPERVLDIVRGALRRIVDRQRITIVVNPDDVATVADGLVQLRSELGGIDEAAVQSDRRIARGGAVIQTEEGALDLQIDSQLARVRSLSAEELTR